jgi:hypothetical protein
MIDSIELAAVMSVLFFVFGMVTGMILMVMLP